MGAGIPMELFQWVVGGMFGLLVTVGGFFFKQIATRLDGIERDLSRRNERISVVESQLDNFNRRLDRIEVKLDLIIESRFSAKKPD
jgi:tetrahydromethanopterin S-methyltransferase subunit G